MRTYNIHPNIHQDNVSLSTCITKRCMFVCFKNKNFIVKAFVLTLSFTIFAFNIHYKNNSKNGKQVYNGCLQALHH